MKEINFMSKAYDDVRSVKNTRAELHLQDLKWKVELRAASLKKLRITNVSVVTLYKVLFISFTTTIQGGEKNGLLPEEAETAAETRKRIDFTYPPPILK
jgi:hypothetical protein